MGRRLTMLMSCFLIFCGNLVVIITWAGFEKGGNTDVKLAKGIIAAMFFVGLGYGGPANTFMATHPAEICPTSVRPTGVAVSYMTQHILIIILVQLTPQAIDAISWRFFLIFVCSTAIFAAVFILFYPETRNKTLEEMEGVFDDNVAETLEEAGQHLDEFEDPPSKKSNANVRPLAVHDENIKA